MTAELKKWRRIFYSLSLNLKLYIHKFQREKDLFTLSIVHIAISRKVVRESARDNPESHCGWFLGHCSSKKFERMLRVATDICLWVLKESNKSRFDSFSHYEQCIDHITIIPFGIVACRFLPTTFLETAVFKFQTLTCQNFWIFYFTSRLTLYECVVNVYIQR